MTTHGAAKASITAKNPPTDRRIAARLNANGPPQGAVCAVLRDDRSGQDGRPLHFGLHSHGELAEGLNYGVDLGAVRGNNGQTPLHGHAVTAGRWRFPYPA